VRALLDEQLSPQIAMLLRQAGHDVLAVADRDDLPGRSDRIVFEIASSEGRALVTNNIKDFRPLAAEWLAKGRMHPGLILLPSARTRTRAAVPALAAAVEAILRAHPDGIAGGERWVGPLPRDRN
jgi:predicted nuclease of predicted toxin-antitoxin system